MGKLIKNHWARLIIMTAASCKPRLSPLPILPSPPRPSLPFSPPLPPQNHPNPHLPTPPNHPTDQIAASLSALFFPKLFFDFLTKTLDGAVKPIPILQILNLLLGLLGLAWEYPLPPLAGTAFHRSVEARLVLYPLSCLAAVLLYQATNAALYYAIGIGVYFWAFSEGEVVCKTPWSLPRKGGGRRGEGLLV